MAGGIDTSNRKPRRLRGTPALKFVNKVAFAVLGIGSLIGIVLYQIPINTLIENKFNIVLGERSEEDIERRKLITESFAQRRTGEELLKLMKDTEDTLQQRETTP